MPISIQSPISGIIANPTLVNPSFNVTGIYDTTVIGSNLDPEDSAFIPPVDATLKRVVKVELVTPIDGNSAASEFADTANQENSGNFTIAVTLPAEDIRRKKPLKLTPILRITNLADEVGATVYQIKTNA